MVLSLLYKFVWMCLSPTFFIYKDVNIFISALSERSVGSIGNEIVFLYCIMLYCWIVYIFLFFTVWFLNQYHSFVSFNHNYSDTWLSFQINITCFYHLRGILAIMSKSRNISFSLSHIKMTKLILTFCFIPCLSFVVFCCFICLFCFFN